MVVGNRGHGEIFSNLAASLEFCSSNLNFMRISTLFICAAIAANAVHAESLSDADREALLGNLETLSQSAKKALDERYGVALAAYRAGMATDSVAADLYRDCVEKVLFKEENKKSEDFRNWRAKESERLSEPSLRLALRHQLQWLALVVQVAAGKIEKEKLPSEVMPMVDSLFEDPKRLQAHVEILNQGVSGTVFAKAYGIENMEVENLPLSPLDIGEIYEQVILPPLRKPEKLVDLRAAWVKRILTETARVEHFGVEQKKKDKQKPQRGKEKEEKVAMGKDSAQYLKFIEEEQPNLQWQMEVDLFKNGDEKAAVVRMYAHIQKHLTNFSATEWATELKELISPTKKSSALTPVE